MKKAAIFLLFFAFIVISRAQNLRVAVLGFNDKTHRISKSIVSTLVDLTTTYLFRTRRFLLLEK